MLANACKLGSMKVTFFRSLNTRERIYYFFAAALTGTIATIVGGMVALVLTIGLWSY